ncbi:MAG: DinB family protein [Bacteroidetes bacterium]|nr:DinB family protein [Bacteroidota bacterium]MCW5897467.1 DinB family protein [Bacteroidota bacterium]
MAELEPWLRGPVAGIDSLLQPVAHSLLQAREDLPLIVGGLTNEQLWATPGGAASIGFHLKHIAASLDRLYTYARGGKLSETQQAALRIEKEPESRNVEELLSLATVQIDTALQQIRETHLDALNETCPVGRAAIPATRFGLLCHGAEHVQRHIGAIIATAKVVREYIR